MNNTIYTVGHSTHTIEKFVQLLKMHDVTALADVRSSPFSRFNPQFNKRELHAALKAHSIQYVFLGVELGARSKDPKCYKDGKVQFDTLAQTELFQKGIERIAIGCEKFSISLMCAEKDPIECHRTILVSRHLKEAGFSVNHILAGGQLQTQEEVEERLISMFKLNNGDLFLNAEEIKEKAYTKQGEAVAYTEQEDAKKADTDRKVQL